jgi:hypothetical protein
MALLHSSRQGPTLARANKNVSQGRGLADLERREMIGNIPIAAKETKI